MAVAGRRGPARGEEPRGLRGDRAERQLGRQRGDVRDDPRLLDLQVAGPAELTRQPAQLHDEVVGAAAVEQRAEGLEGAAHPPAGHAHGVHRLRGVAADLRIRRADRLGLLGDVGEHDLARRRVRERHGPRRGGRDPLGEHPAQLRGRRRPVHPGALQRLVDPVEHLHGALPGQLDLDLGPLEGLGVDGRAAAGTGAEGAGGDPVVGDGGDGLPLASVSVHSFRTVSSSTTGPSGASRWAARLSATNGAGGLRARPSGRRTSSRLSAPAGSLRCQPASSPPTRRRSVSLDRSRRRSAVSQ